MKIKAQYAMILNLDKCIGCHTCSIPCKHVWTNRQGAEYMWFNNVESKPGIGYPKKWEHQQLYKGGWHVENGRLRLKAGGRVHKGLNIFHNPDLPAIDAYYEPWTYDYEKLTASPRRRHQPSIRPKSQLTGKPVELRWGPNWEDDLAGAARTGPGDANFKDLDHAVYLRFRDIFMFYLPRLCEHCLNPACVASCPSGALYKRDEDGIVLVDQERCRGWRYCVSGCPYKKVYFNWRTGRAEKCIFCYPRIESGQTTLCAHSCVGRIRYVGVVLYDAEKIAAAASVSKDKDVYPAQLGLLLDPGDPRVQEAAAAEGIAPNMIAAAVRSPIFKLAKAWKLALPLHPEFRTLPMVWYIPPLSPLRQLEKSAEGADPVDHLRIPVKYLANLLTAGDEEPVRLALKRLMALRRFMRARHVEGHSAEGILAEVGLSVRQAEEIYHLLALAPHGERFVVPTRDRRRENPHTRQGCCGIPDCG